MARWPDGSLNLSAPDVSGLGLGVEFDRGEALLTRAVARLAGAAERHVIIDARRRQVDHHHPGAHVAAEVARIFERVRDDAGGQSKLSTVGNLQRLFVVSHLYRARDRTEDFLAVDPMLRLGVGNDRRRHVPAAPVELEAFGTASEYFAAVIERDLHVAEVLVELTLADCRADLRLRVERIADAKRASLFGQRFDETVVNAFGH